jgi:hypothetical protein
MGEVAIHRRHPLPAECAGQGEPLRLSMCTAQQEVHRGKERTVKVNFGRRAGLGLAVAAGAMALVALAASPAAASPLFCGGGRGLTADVAIQGAFWDAQGSAQAEG